MYGIYINTYLLCHQLKRPEVHIQLSSIRLKTSGVEFLLRLTELLSVRIAVYYDSPPYNP
jgi:hypothetical protein